MILYWKIFIVIVIITILILLGTVIYLLVSKPRECYADTLCNMISSISVDFKQLQKQLVGPITDNFVFKFNLVNNIINIPLDTSRLTFKTPDGYKFNSNTFSIFNPKSQWDNIFISVGSGSTDPLIVYIPDLSKNVNISGDNLSLKITKTNISNMTVMGLNKIDLNMPSKGECSPVQGNNSIQYKSDFNLSVPLTINLDLYSEIDTLTTITLTGPLVINMVYSIKGTYQFEGTPDIPNNKINLDHFYMEENQEQINNINVDMSKVDIQLGSNVPSSLKDTIIGLIQSNIPPILQNMIQEAFQSIDIIKQINIVISSLARQMPFSFNKNVCDVMDKFVNNIKNQIETLFPTGKPVSDVTFTTLYGNKTITVSKDKLVFPFNSKVISLINPKSTWDAIYLSAAENSTDPFTFTIPFTETISKTGHTVCSNLIADGLLNIFDIVIGNLNDINISFPSSSKCDTDFSIFDFNTVHTSEMLLSIPNNLSLDMNFNCPILEVYSTYCGFQCHNPFKSCGYTCKDLSKPCGDKTLLMSTSINGSVSQQIDVQLQVTYTIDFKYDLDNDAINIDNIKIIMTDDQLQNCINRSIAGKPIIDMFFTNFHTIVAGFEDTVENHMKIFIPNILRDKLPSVIRNALKTKLPHFIDTLNTNLSTFNKTIKLH